LKDKGKSGPGDNQVQQDETNVFQQHQYSKRSTRRTSEALPQTDK
jgi:hypothetical protein